MPFHSVGDLLIKGFMTIAIFVIAPLGCAHESPGAPITADVGLPDAQLQALMTADKKISDGTRMKEQGLALRAEGKGGDVLIHDGDQMVSDGRRERETAERMR